MPKEYPRSSRVADLLQRELAGLLRTQIKDPRLSSMITITAVEVTADLNSAKIFLSFLNKDETSLPVLRQAAGFLRRELSKTMRMRKIPELRFILDETVERSAHLSALIAKARAKDQAHTADEDDGNA